MISINIFIFLLLTPSTNELIWKPELSHVSQTKSWTLEVTEERSEREGTDVLPFPPPLAGETVPVEEQFDKEKAKAEVQALDSALNNDKTAPAPALSTLPGVKLTDAEKEKYEAEMAKLYKEMDDKVRKEPQFGECPYHISITHLTAS